MPYEIIWNQDFYAIVHKQTQAIVVNGNMWDYGWHKVKRDFNDDADAFLMDLHKDTIEEYERTQ